MKKLVVMMLTGVMVFSLAACGGKDDIAKNPESSVGSPSSVESSVEESSEESSIEESGEESEGSEAVEMEGAAGILNTIWSKVDTENQFPVAGGDMEHSVMDAAGTFDLTDASLVDSSLGFPADKVELVDDAGSLMHMMNANTFTGAAFHLTDADKMEEVAKAAKENILQRQWMCGFPEKLVVASVDDYLLTFFGNGEAIETFKTALTGAYENAQIISEDNIE